jgi:stigma-specific protein Stig1
MFPKARHENLTVRDLPDETLVFDHDRNKAHCLNREAALVWRHCDGRTGLPALARIVSEELRIPNAESVAQLALEQLSRRNLLEEAVTPLAGEARVSRRDVLRKLCAAAVAMPVVMTLTAPNARAGISDVDCTKAVDGYPCVGILIAQGSCCGGICRGPGDYSSDQNNCGACGNRCPSGTFCVNGVCTNPVVPPPPPPPQGGQG